MNILYISYDGITDPLGQSQVLPYLIQLSIKGHKITLLSCEKRKEMHHYHQTQELLKKYKIEWIGLNYTKNPPILSTLLDIYKLWRKALQLSKTNKYNIVHCRSYIASLVGLKIKKRFETKFIFDMRGFWADERIEGNIWKKNNWIYNKIYNFFKKKEIEFLSKANYTISLTENAKKEINTWTDISDKPIPIEVIPCCVDTSFFNAENISLTTSENLLASLNLKKDDFIISYLGSIGTWYMLDEMLDFFKCLMTKREKAKFLFITTESPQLISTKAKAKGIPLNKIIITKSSRREVPSFLNLSKISIFFIKPTYSKKASSPTKLAEVMSMGLPVICNTNIGDVDAIILKTKVGAIIKEFSIAEYHKIIGQIDSLLLIDKNHIRKAAHEFFSLEKGVELYDKVYTNC